MREGQPLRALSDDERQQLKAGLRYSKAFTLRRCQILLASAPPRPKHRLLHRPLVIMVTAKFRGLSPVPATAYLEDVSMHRIVGGVLVLVLGMAGAETEAEGQDRQPATPEQQYQALLKEYNDAFQAYAKAYAEAKTPEEQQAVVQSKYPWPDKYA